LPPRKTAVLAALILFLALAAGLYVNVQHRPQEEPPAAGTTPAAPGLPSAFNFVRREPPKPLPEIHFVDDEGRPMTLASFRGRVVLLNLWATWCGPCREEMPTLDRLQAKMGGPDFEVVALSIDEKGMVVVAPFFREIGVKTLRPYVDETGKSAAVLGVVGLPTTILIDRNGNELGSVVGAANWDSPEVVRLVEGAIVASP
jgi:thiol-disulfide isomerase/thioredoxin